MTNELKTWGIRFLNRYAPLVLLVFCPMQASATVIGFDVVQLDPASNRWRYDYTIENNSLAAPIEQFTIYFDLGLYDDLAVVASPSNWDSLALPPDPNIPDDGFFDSLTLSSGIAPSAILGGFSVSFVYTGNNAPSSQRFEILDDFFRVVDSGFTQPIRSNSVPEPASSLLFLIGLLAVVVSCHRSKQSIRL